MQLAKGCLVVMILPNTDIPIYATLLVTRENDIMLDVKQYWLLREDSITTCIFVDGNEMFEYYGKISRIDKNVAHIRSYRQSTLTSVDNRKFNRIACDIGFLAKLQAMNNIPLTETKLASKKFMGRIKNISATGVMVQTDLCLPQGMRFNLNLNIGDFVDKQAEVKWSEQKLGICSMGCQFVNQSVEEVRQLSMFVFQEYIKQESKNLSKIG